MLQILCNDFCLYIGLLTVGYGLFKLIYKFAIPPYNLYTRYGGGWAVVTGGSDGIGLGFCQELAKLGFNICIVSRNKQKIQKVCDQLRKINDKIETKTVVADFANSMQPNFYENIVKQISEYDISVLVNNVGYLAEISPFHELPPSQIFTQSTLNMMPIAMLTRLLMPKMLLRSHRSAIICLSSSSINLRLSRSANYCSTKLFDHAFAKSLHYEWQHKLDILSVKPGLVTTAMARNLTSFVHSSKNSTAKGALRALGRYNTYAGSKWHELQDIIVSFIPEIIRDKIMGEVIWGNMGQTYKQIDLQNNNNKNKQL